MSTGTSPSELQVTVDDVNRILEVGRILASVLTDEELQNFLTNMTSSEQSEIPCNSIPNSGDSPYISSSALDANRTASDDLAG